jgi:uncharacterized protein
VTPVSNLLFQMPAVTQRATLGSDPSTRTRKRARLHVLTNIQTSGKGEPMRYFALFYDVVDDFLERRAPYREAHLRLAQEAHNRGDILLVGALGMPPDRALLLFRANDASIADAFARADPYVVNGLVTRWEVLPWAVVIGNEPEQRDPSTGAG